MTADAALQEHGLSGEALLKLSRKAANDALRRKGAFLDEHRFEDLADYMLEVGVKYSIRYEPGHGIGMSTFLYRTMRIRYVDWCRLVLGDSRVKDRGGRSRGHPPGGRLYSFDEVRDTAVIDRGYEEVEERLSAV